jgi:hypothetical protein
MESGNSNLVSAGKLTHTQNPLRKSWANGIEPLLDPRKSFNKPSTYDDTLHGNRVNWGDTHQKLEKSFVLQSSSTTNRKNEEFQILEENVLEMLRKKAEAQKSNAQV